MKMLWNCIYGLWINDVAEMTKPDISDTDKFIYANLNGNDLKY